MSGGVRVGLLGCGDWGRNHARALRRFGVLAAVADADAEVAAATAAEFACDAVAPGALIADARLDALVIAVDPRRHAALATAALEAGRHVLVEKPMALGAADAERVRAAAARAGRIAMTGHILRFHPAFEALLRLVRQGALGRLRRAEAVRKGFGKFFPGVDVVWDLAPHDLSLLLTLAGRPPVRGEGRRARVLSDAADAAEIDLDFGDGFAATVRLSRVFPGKERRLVLTGERGVAVFDDLAPWPGKLTLALDGGAPEPVTISETAPLDAELRHFLDCIADGTEPLAGTRHAIEVLSALEAVRMRDVSHAELPSDLHPVGGARRRGARAAG